MARTISEAVRNTIEGMLLSGKVTCEICCHTGVSAPTVRKIRNELMKNGKGGLWHTKDYLVSKGFA